MREDFFFSFPKSAWIHQGYRLSHQELERDSFASGPAYKANTHYSPPAPPSSKVQKSFTLLFLHEATQSQMATLFAVQRECAKRKHMHKYINKLHTHTHMHTHLSAFLQHLHPLNI